MILAKSWWDSGGSEATFLLIGALLTIVTAFVAEGVKHRQERERRTDEWQRATLLELQDATTDLIEFLGWGVEYGQRPQRSALYPRVATLASRIIDSEVQVQATSLLDAYDRWMYPSDEDFDSPGLDEYRACSDAWSALNDRIGELLRTTYA